MKGYGQFCPLTMASEVVGERWLPATLSRDNTDPDLIMWDMHRRMAIDRLPATRTVLQFELVDQPDFRRYRWLVGSRSGVDLCITDPGYEVDVFVSTDSRTLTWTWYGDITLEKAIADNRIKVHGPRHLCEAFPSWLKLSLVADVPRRRSSDSAAHD